MSNSNAHDHRNLPALVLSGVIPGDRHIMAGVLSETRDNENVPKFSEETPYSNLLVTLMNAAGVESETFGIGEQQSTGRIDL
jgi:hypothetical protein